MSGEIIMEDRREEQIEALETLSDFNEKVIKNVGILLKELSGARLEDTEAFLESILKALNWEIQVLNGTLGVLNEGRQRIDKEIMNKKVIALSKAVQSKEDEELAAAFSNLLPELENLKAAVQEVLAQ